MSAEAIGLTPVSTAAPAVPGSQRIPQKSLGQNDFFKLLSVQLAAQDPLKPMEDTAFISQMANFSSLEMMNQMTKSFSDFTNRQDFSAAQNLIGRTVTLLDSPNTEVTGVVSAVFRDGKDTLITVNGLDYDVGSVRRVEQTGTPTVGN
jgi:flagellar basal-body rod modification protein FlgD